MPVPLNEMDSLSFINPSYNQDITGLRYASPPVPEDSYKNFTMLGNTMSCQTALPRGTQSPQWMSQDYNSNGIIPSYQQATCPSSAQQFIDNQARMGIQQGNGITFIDDPFAAPRATSFYNTVAQAQAPIMQYSTNFQAPPFPASIPGAQNAVLYDVTVPLVPQQGMVAAQYAEAYKAPPQPAKKSPSTSSKEGFEQIEKTDLKCIECSKHVVDCGLCKKICAKSNKKLYLVIGILVAIIVLLIAYIMMLKRPTVVNVGRRY
jgi:hypothetical protein